MTVLREMIAAKVATGQAVVFDVSMDGFVVTAAGDACALGIYAGSAYQNLALVSYQLGTTKLAKVTAFRDPVIAAYATTTGISVSSRSVVAVPHDMNLSRINGAIGGFSGQGHSIGLGGALSVDLWDAPIIVTQGSGMIKVVGYSGDNQSMTITAAVVAW